MRTLIISSAALAALFAAVPANAQQNLPFCLRGAGSGSLDCSYQTMAQCQESMKGTSITGTCVANPRTTGQGSQQAPGRMNPPPAGNPPAPR